MFILFTPLYQLNGSVLNRSIQPLTLSSCSVVHILHFFQSNSTIVDVIKGISHAFS